ncbi:hypothetical protein [Metabacillus sp. Hm71]|uniref:hypothetical protein n=1 Tax=Metabacillus sp. Hm71 TaxID=3450743 RepID=UPI003F4237A2
MSKYFKLVHFEFNRFANMYFILIGITIISQLIGVFVSAKSYVNTVNEMIYQGSLSQEEFLNQYGSMSLQHFIDSFWFVGPIALCIVTLLIYLFFIWYRDWIGKNTFIYRLLMLPTARIHLYLAKVTTIMIMVFGLIALQLLLLPVENNILQLIVPADFRTDLTVHETFMYNRFTILFPKTFMEFFIHYGIGFLVVMVLFTAILFERSFRWKGIALAVIYCLVSAFVFLSPLLIHTFLLVNYFYPIELLGLELITGLIVIAGSIWMSHYLLKNKITV